MSGGQFKALQFNEVWILAHYFQLANPDWDDKQRPYLCDISTDNSSVNNVSLFSIKNKND